VRHKRTGRKLGRDSAHRKALFSNLAGQLFAHGRIRTTEAKAKELRPIAERLITLARKDPMDVAAQRQAVAYLRSKDAVHTLFHQVGPRFVDRPGGYTRIVKLGPRPGDSAPMVYIELVDFEPAVAAPAAG
jgi:large subunit ribosomal protein L17